MRSSRSIGTGKGTCTLDDFERADLIIVIGQNPASNHPRMMAALHEAKLRGASVLAINPLRERGFANFSDPKNVGELLRDEGIAVADEIYQVRIGGDFALLKGVMKALLESERATPGAVFDHAFIKQHTEGLGALVADLDACDWSDLAARSGLAEERIRDIARRYAAAPATMLTWCMGLTPPPARRGNHPAGAQSCAAARQHRPRRRRRGAGARPLQCAGRPDHGRDLDRVRGLAGQSRSQLPGAGGLPRQGP
jgi:anaerobic selenocysteine-containing dehydrogenase